ncbi:hypothetical protein [Marimonas lutisalis]|uniref:hypothetical protein n=1 Tax=Marimonas lutisalis TaxID=2545756 RepID=UPI0010F46905|nr:hypothetical protein [Marimonas lutisalis]
MTQVKPVPARIPETPMLDGETLLARWQPRFWLFAQRSLLLGFVTALALSGFGFLVWWQWLLALPVLTLVYIFVFDDLATWVRHRGERWYLTSMRLIFENHESPEDHAAIPLASVAWAKPWFWWSLRLGLDSGTATSIRYIPQPREARRRILAARAAATGESDA